MRIKFIDSTSRIYFFNLLKERYNKSWKDIRLELNLSRNCLDRYKSGRNLIPEQLFLKLVNKLNNKERDRLIIDIEKLPDNHGQVIGGKRAYKINFEKFNKGRKKGILAIRKKRFSKEDVYVKEIQEINKFYSVTSNLTPSICEFIGAFIGDGFFNCYNNKAYQIEFTGDSRRDLNYYNTVIVPFIIKIIPNLNPRVYLVDDKNIVRVRFYSKYLFFFLKEVFDFIPGKKAYTVKIPKKITNSSLELVYATIRGIFDTDGGVFIDKRKTYNKPYPRIVFQTVSNPLYNQLIYYLSKEFKIYHRHNKIRNVYVIEIYGHNQIKKWMSLIGFSNKRHLDKIASVA